MQGFNTQVDIHVHSKRHRLTDPDGASAKAVIDGLVKSGVLVNDSAKEVRKVSYSQEKIKTDEPESTIITIEEV